MKKRVYEIGFKGFSEVRETEVIFGPRCLHHVFFTALKYGELYRGHAMPLNYAELKMLAQETCGDFLAFLQSSGEYQWLKDFILWLQGAQKVFIEKGAVPVDLDQKIIDIVRSSDEVVFSELCLLVGIEVVVRKSIHQEDGGYKRFARRA